MVLEITELTGELPVDKYGLDVSHIWNVVRREVRDIPGWEVGGDGYNIYFFIFKTFNVDGFM